MRVDTFSEEIQENFGDFISYNENELNSMHFIVQERVKRLTQVPGNEAEALLLSSIKIQKKIESQLNSQK